MSIHLIRWLALLIFLPMQSLADTLVVKDSAPEIYVVKKGDTLWDISSLFLHKPWLWPELWRTNSHIQNPHLIYPGDELHLTFDAQGQASMRLVRGRGKAQLKLTPQGHKTVKPPVPIAAIPWSLIQSFVEKDVLMDQAEYDRLPYLLGDQQGAVRFASGDTVLSKTPRKLHASYRIVRKQNQVLDQFGNLLGVQVRHVAEARPLDVELDNQWLVDVVQANFEAKRGDRLLPYQLQPMSPMQLKAATSQKGQIVDNLEQHELLGKFDVVVVDLGKSQVDPGTVMGLYLQGPAIHDGAEPLYAHENNFLRSAFGDGEQIQQPAIKAGELVIFKVFDKASYGLITRASKVIRKGTIVANP